MNVRYARVNESEQLTALALAAKSSWGYSAGQLGAWADELRISAESIITEPTFVLEDEGHLLGVLQLKRMANLARRVFVGAS
jgi:hypothetical protein